MPVPRHLDAAVAALDAADRRLKEAREQPVTLDSLATWLEALTDYAMAQTDIQRFNNESLHEKVTALSKHLRVPLAQADRRH